MSAKSLELQENVSLAPYTTLGIGGPARFFATIETEAGLIEAVHLARRNRLPIFTLGGGSNLVVSDEGFPGIVLHLTLGEGASTARLASKMHVRAPAGADWNALVLAVCSQGVSGIECLAGIPGLVGGAPIQNIGAYGQEVAGTVSTVRALDLKTLNFVEISNRACCFSYRKSIFNSTERGRYLVTRVDFTFYLASKPDLSYADLSPLRGTHLSPIDVYHAVRAIRDRKGMVIHPDQPDPDTRSAGSFFKNPIVPAATLSQIAAALSRPADEIPHWPVLNHTLEQTDPAGPVAQGEGSVKLAAAWLIEQTGFSKGFELGPVGISTRHTLALVNRTGTATCAELLALRDLITSTVKERFGVTLEQEPVLLA